MVIVKQDKFFSLFFFPLWLLSPRRAVAPALSDAPGASVGEDAQRKQCCVLVHSKLSFVFVKCEMRN